MQLIRNIKTEASDEKQEMHHLTDLNDGNSDKYIFGSVLFSFEHCFPCFVCVSQKSCMLEKRNKMQQP